MLQLLSSWLAGCWKCTYACFCCSFCFGGHTVSKLLNESQLSLGTTLHFINAKINRPGVGFIKSNVFIWQWWCLPYSSIFKGSWTQKTTPNIFQIKKYLGFLVSLLCWGLQVLIHVGNDHPRRDLYWEPCLPFLNWLSEDSSVVSFLPPKHKHMEIFRAKLKWISA